jgi:hypothetical protein
MNQPGLFHEYTSLVFVRTLRHLLGQGDRSVPLSKNYPLPIV